MNWIKQFLKREELYEDLSEEIREHIEERTGELIEGRMSPQEAKRTARLQFGNPAVIGRAIWFGSIFEDLLLRLEVQKRIPRAASAPA